MQTATNPETGEQVMLTEGGWQKIEQSATNDKGQKAYLVSGKWLSDTPKTAESNAAPEFGKGLLRGASEVAGGIRKATTSLLLGPVMGPAAERALSSVEMGREAVQAAPTDAASKFAGTAGEIAGGGIAGGGVAGGLRGALISPRGALITGGSALGGATGEAMGGDIGKFTGIIAGGFGSATASAILSKARQVAGDVAATIGSSFGNKAGIERLASKAVTARAGEEAPRVKQVLGTPETYVPGAKVTAAEAIAGPQIGKPEQFGGSLARMQKDLSGAPGVEDVLPSVTRQQDVKALEHLKNLTAKTTPMREAALDAANQTGGVRVAPLIAQIDEIGSRPGLRASEVVTKSLESVREKLLAQVETGGKIDARDLYTIRKEIGNTIRTHVKETANWDKKLTGGLEREIQKSIDEAIVRSGGTGWKEYLSTESMGRQMVDKMEARREAAAQMQAQVKGQSSNIVSGELPQAPTLLSRPMMVVNYGLKLVAQDANDPVVKRIATAMQDSTELAKLIKLPLNHPDRKAMNYILNALVSSKMDQAAKDAIQGAPGGAPNIKQ